ncbi:MAG TPA: hypothetical protein VLL48_13790 [Longimicrobiales bacterium]|nr:hypothetical protein [Longimicrobiales bacterium]
MEETTRTLTVDPAPVPSTVPRTRTGARVKELVEDVKADLGDISELLTQARERVTRLEEEGRGINGFSAACRGWGQHLAKMLADIAEEQKQVERTMLGRSRPPIAVSIDDDLQHRIAVARGA